MSKQKVIQLGNRLLFLDSRVDVRCEGDKVFGTGAVQVGAFYKADGLNLFRPFQNFAYEASDLRTIADYMEGQ